MGISEVQGKLLALLGSSVTDTIDLKDLLVSITYTGDHVLQKRTGQSVKGLLSLKIVRSLNDELVDLDCLLVDFLLNFLGVDLHFRDKRSGERSLGTLNGNFITILDLNGNSRRDHDRHSANS